MEHASESPESSLLCQSTLPYSGSRVGIDQPLSHLARSAQLSRIYHVDVRDGAHYYWSKGDNNPEPDGCWVPEQHVQGYITEMYRNVRPENAELRELVNAAKDAYHEARIAYYALRDQYCQRDEHCTAPSHIYVSLEALGAVLDATWDYFDCWQESARQSEYPGHIPHRC